MAKPVKRRPYSSVVRQEQAAQTRARILDAAAGLFESNGYARTTVAAIAERANVAADTVYTVFGNKARVLTALIDQRLAPAAGTANVTDRPAAVAVRAEVDQRRQLHLFARDIAAISATVRPVYEILRTASAVEPEMAAVHAEMDGYRLQNMRRVAGWLAARGPLRVDVDRAGEVIWAVASPDVARLLCDVRAWSQDEYAAWLEDTLVRALLPGSPSPG
jgi:AcrR family transcriptional regulator